MRILLADDDGTIRVAHSLMLRDMGHSVDMAVNGREAVTAATQTAYDVILMDVQMPEMNGFEATRKIRALNLNGLKPRIIAVTSDFANADRDTCLREGMDDYLPKPVMFGELTAALERAVVPAG